MWPQTWSSGWHGPRTEPDLQWIRTVEPSESAISLQDARDQLRVTQPQGNARIQRYIDAAVAAAEDHLGRGLVTQTWQLTLPYFADIIWLPMAAPLQSVTTVKYYDTNGTLQTLATSNYVVDTGSRPGRVLRAANQSWPGLQSGRVAGRVIVTYVVGWTDPALVPESIKQGCRIYIALCDADADGLDPNHDRALQAAQHCWSDRVSVIWPEMGYRPYWASWLP